MIAREALGLLIRERQDPGQPNADRGFSREFAGATTRAACPDGSSKNDQLPVRATNCVETSAKQHSETRLERRQTGGSITLTVLDQANISGCLG
jgi:hypothetical protein